MVSIINVYSIRQLAITAPKHTIHFLRKKHVSNPAVNNYSNPLRNQFDEGKKGGRVPKVGGI